MSEFPPVKILVGVAWPYANNRLHIGHFAGALLPPDIFARFQRMCGRDVLMVSGSDSHGTPITVTADGEGISPREVVEKYHAGFVDSLMTMGITFDLFTTTMTRCHEETVHELFKNHLERGYLYRETTSQVYDPKTSRFLPDRYVEGVCPHCGFDGARGDQCDNCGKTYNATELKNPRSKISGSTNLEIRDTEHFFFDLGKLTPKLSEYLSVGKEHWRPAVLNFSQGLVNKRELQGRAITRDLEWGVTVPAPGFEGKRIYVWYEAVMGYLSAAREWARIQGKADLWKNWWQEKDTSKARSYNFIGKDNIEFHTVLWPALLMAASDGYALPYDVPANDFLNSYGRKFSKSRGNAVFVQDVLQRYEPDAWRYVLTAIAPETADADFTWDDFLERVNNELVANWGNLANRLLSYTAKQLGGTIPECGALSAAEEELLKSVKEGFSSIGKLYDQVKLRSACEALRALCQKVNQYLSDRAPWTLAKTDLAAAKTAVYVGLQCVDWLSTMWAPILPFSSQVIHTALGYQGELFGTLEKKQVGVQEKEHLVLMYAHGSAVGEWKPRILPQGQPLGPVKAPFQKLDPKLLTQETT